MVCLLGVGLIETLRAHLELQVLHQFEDVVMAFEHQNILVADGVVTLLVVQIHQRGDLRELVGNVLHQCKRLLAVFALPAVFLIIWIFRNVKMELEYQHPLTAGAVANDDVAQQTHLLAQVEERQVVLDGVAIHLVADLVVQIVHQPAFLYRKNLVERPRNVESDGGHIFL